jgi:hypothetical protein
MRIFLGFALAAPLLLGGVGSAGAQNYPWCAQYGTRDSFTNCGFVSYEQCRAAISGNGGYCQRNPMFNPRAPMR